MWETCQLDWFRYILFTLGAITVFEKICHHVQLRCSTCAALPSTTCVLCSYPTVRYHDCSRASWVRTPQSCVSQSRVVPQVDCIQQSYHRSVSLLSSLPQIAHLMPRRSLVGNMSLVLHMCLWTSNNRARCRSNQDSYQNQDEICRSRRWSYAEPRSTGYHRRCSHRFGTVEDTQVISGSQHRFHRSRFEMGRSLRLDLRLWTCRHWWSLLSRWCTRKSCPKYRSVTQHLSWPFSYRVFSSEEESTSSDLAMAGQRIAWLILRSS